MIEKYTTKSEYVVQYEGSPKIMEFKFPRAPFCEHCGDLEPYTAIYFDGCDWCLGCVGVVFNKEDKEQIMEIQNQAKIIYFEKRLEELRS